MLDFFFFFWVDPAFGRIVGVVVMIEKIIQKNMKVVLLLLFQDTKQANNLNVPKIYIFRFAA